MGYRRTKRHGKPCRVFIEILEVVWLLKVGIEAKHKSNITELRGCVKKTPLFNQNYNDALTFAENDLKSNWAY